MEFFKKRYPDSKEVDKKDIVYSKSVKAGKRIYYLDVKQSRNEEWYLAITESKRNVIDKGPGAMPDIQFEKHKIFLYPEDMQNFSECLNDMINFIHEHQPQLFEKALRREDYATEFADAPAAGAAAEVSLEATEDLDLEQYKPLDLNLGDF